MALNRDNLQQFQSLISNVTDNFSEYLGPLMTGAVTLDQGVNYILEMVSQLGPTGVIILAFIFGSFIGLALLLFVRIAYFYSYDNPARPGIFNEFFNEEFGNADFFRRVIEAVDQKF